MGLLDDEATGGLLGPGRRPTTGAIDRRLAQLEAIRRRSEPYSKGWHAANDGIGQLSRWRPWLDREAERGPSQGAVEMLASLGSWLPGIPGGISSAVLFSELGDKLDRLKQQRRDQSSIHRADDRRALDAQIADTEIDRWTAGAGIATGGAGRLLGPLLKLGRRITAPGKVITRSEAGNALRRTAIREMDHLADTAALAEESAANGLKAGVASGIKAGRKGPTGGPIAPPTLASIDARLTGLSDQLRSPDNRRKAQIEDAIRFWEWQRSIAARDNSRTQNRSDP